MAQSKVRRDSMIVASFDLGTTFSGYAYSFKNDPSRVVTNQSWIAGGRALISLKTPTCVLLNQKQEFDSFGYDAENKYAGLAEDDIHHGWYFFQRFKMALHNDKNLSLDTVVEDIAGRSFPAITVFSMTIKYLKDHLMKTLQQRLPDVTFDDVDVVLTVPAIWDDKAKQFMREAAKRAGIDNNQLKISLEPEAASVWCQTIESDVQRASGKLRIAAAGTRYMIVDIGGGTADIVVHEKMKDGTLKEIHSASGGPWGGIEVDKAFVNLLTNIVGDGVMKRFRKENMADYIDLLRDFEIKKRAISGATDGKIVIKIPISLKDTYDECGESTIADIRRKFGNNVEWKGDKMRFQANLIKDCFNFTVRQLTSHVRGILLERPMQRVDQIMLVGGFSECTLVQEAFKEHFKDRQIIIPDGCGTVVLKGAVLYGHRPKTVSTRVARYTYGMRLAVPFIEGFHPEEHRFDGVNGKYCTDTFWKIVEIGQDLPLGHAVSRVGHPEYQANASCQVEFCLYYDIFQTTQRSPKMVTDEGCVCIGSMPVNVPAVNRHQIHQNTYDQIFTFGDTELKYSTYHHLTGETSEIYLKF